MISDILVKLTFWMGRLGYPGVFISTVGVLPAEVVITMVAATKTDQIFQIAAVASLCEVVGALWTYAIGYYFKDKDVLGFLNGKGKWMNISEKTFNKSNKYVKKRGFLYIILTRFTPGLRVAVLLVAGYLKYNVFAASVAVFIGTFIYAFGFAYLGSKIGFNWDQIKRVMDMINGGLTILTLSVIGFLIYKNKERLLQLFRKETSK